MKIKDKLLMLTVVPVVVLGIALLVVAGINLQTSMAGQAYGGMQATTIAIREMFDAIEGDYYLNDAGELMKGELNISQANDIADKIKNNTGYDVTVCYGDKRMLTSIINESGNREVGTTVSAEVTSKVLSKGDMYISNNVKIQDTTYICCYIPFYQNNTSEIIGMIFLGEDFENIRTIIISTETKIAVAVLIILIIVLIVVSGVGRRIAFAITEMGAKITLLSEHKLNIEMDARVIERKDEIGESYRGVKRLADSLRTIITGLQAEAVNIEETAKESYESVKKVLDATQEINAAAEEMAAISTSQAQEAVRTEGNVSTMGDGIENTSKFMVSVEDSVAAMKDAEVNAKNILTELNDDMDNVRVNVKKIEEKTNETHASVEQISQMTEIISGIASKTNLLSLNASIEAARAGEVGKGFAVVAGEIKSLAEQSNQSALEIQEILQELKQKSEESVEAMGEMTREIDEQGKMLTNTKEAFDIVDNGISNSVDNIDKIKGEIYALTQARDQAIAGVKSVAENVTQNAAGTEQTAASVEEVYLLMGHLKKQIDALRSVSEKLDEHASIFEL